MSIDFSAPWYNDSIQVWMLDDGTWMAREYSGTPQSFADFEGIKAFALAVREAHAPAREAVRRRVLETVDRAMAIENRRRDNEEFLSELGL